MPKLTAESGLAGSEFELGASNLELQTWKPRQVDNSQLRSLKHRALSVRILLRETVQVDIPVDTARHRRSGVTSMQGKLIV